jgi:hypothetical protein
MFGAGAVTEPLYATAVRHQVDISVDQDGQHPLGSLSDLLDRALELGQAVADLAEPAAEPT